MRILYGVTGCGLGHTMRARTLAQHLRDEGHDVTIAASGRAVSILRGHGFPVLPIDGMTMHFERGEVRRARTVLDMLKRTPHALAHNADVALGDALDFLPDMLVTDFDSFTATLGALFDRPVISVDHQHVLDRFRHPRQVRESVSSFGIARAFETAKTPRCSRYLVSSFFFPEPRWDKSTLVGPIVRHEIERAAVTSEDHVLVYQTTSGDPRLIASLLAVPRARFVIYGLGRDEIIGNVQLRAFDESRFVRDLASCRAVISNGGFTTISEALYLGKPVLSLPVRRQPEQELNAAWLEVIGAGERVSILNAPTVARFLDRASDFEYVQDARIRTGSRDAKRALSLAIAEAA